MTFIRSMARSVLAPLLLLLLLPLLPPAGANQFPSTELPVDGPMENITAIGDVKVVTELPAKGSTDRTGTTDADKFAGSTVTATDRGRERSSVGK